jgi:hypothetical protein
MQVRFCGFPWKTVENYVARAFDARQYAILIRGKAIIFAGIIGVETPIGWPRGYSNVSRSLKRCAAISM